MDFNDIKSRLERILKSLNGRFNEDIDRKVKYNTIHEETNTIISTTLGSLNESEILNKIILILHNLANLKDHLKNNFNTKGIKKQKVEDEINNSIHLKVLIDLVNQEKHGYPLTKSKRSNKDPLISNPRQSLGINHSADGTFVAFDFNGTYSVTGGEGILIIDADILDAEKNFLFSLDELVNICYLKMINLAIKYDCINDFDLNSGFRINSPSTIIYGFNVVLEKKYAPNTHEVISLKEEFYEKINDQFKLIDIELDKPLSVKMSAGSLNFDESELKFNKLIESLKTESISRLIENFKNSDNYRRGNVILSVDDHYLFFEDRVLKLVNLGKGNSLKTVNKIIILVKINYSITEI